GTCIRGTLCAAHVCRYAKPSGTDLDHFTIAQPKHGGCMKIALFYHSLRSDWNHGNAHFLRGIVSELHARGHQVSVFEPRAGWSVVNLVAEHGTAPLRAFRKAYPHLRSTFYSLERLGLDRLLDGVDLVLVHEWNEPELVRRIGAHHQRNHDYVLLFHDTHHRSVTNPDSFAAPDLKNYDGVLAYGRAIRSEEHTSELQSPYDLVC